MGGAGSRWNALTSLADYPVLSLPAILRPGGMRSVKRGMMAVRRVSKRQDMGQKDLQTDSETGWGDLANRVRLVPFANKPMMEFQ